MSNTEFLKLVDHVDKMLKPAPPIVSPSVTILHQGCCSIILRDRPSYFDRLPEHLQRYITMPDYEVELKFPVPDIGAFEKLLLTKQPQELGPPVLEIDDYYDREDGSFRTNDEWLRVRRYTQKDFPDKPVPKAVMTYKGPRREGGTKTRIEIQSQLDNADTWLETIFDYHLIVQVRKYRRSAVFKVSGEPGTLGGAAGATVKIELDDVWTLGSYVELEIAGIKESMIGQAEAAIKKVATELLGDAAAKPEQRGYAMILLDKMEKAE